MIATAQNVHGNSLLSRRFALFSSFGRCMSPCRSGLTHANHMVPRCFAPLGATGLRPSRYTRLAALARYCLLREVHRISRVFRAQQFGDTPAAIETQFRSLAFEYGLVDILNGRDTGRVRLETTEQTNKVFHAGFLSVAAVKPLSIGRLTAMRNPIRLPHGRLVPIYVFKQR